MSVEIRRGVAALLFVMMLLAMWPVTALAYDESHPENLSAGDLSAQSAILIDGHTGRVLFSKDADTKRYPASTTKVMTLMLALQYVTDLNAKVVIPSSCYNVPADSSAVGLIAGEEMTWAELLYTFHICSGNDAGMAIATLVAGDTASFVDMMNRKAEELGCTNTHFANPHGYHDDNHYTTASDMAKIALAAMKDETFRQIVSTTNYTIKANNKRSSDVTKWTKNQFIARNDTKMLHKYIYGTGIKTGYTSKAGQCFVGSASKDGVDLISVVFKDSDANSKWVSSIRLMEYGFATYAAYSPVELYNQHPTTITVSGAKEGDPSGGVLQLNINEHSGAQPVCAKKSELQSIRESFSDNIQVTLTREATAPINAGDTMGTLTYTAPTGENYSYLLTAANSIEAAPAPQTTSEPAPQEVTPEATSQGGGEGLTMWIAGIGSIIGVLAIMIVINNLRSHKRYSARSGKGKGRRNG